MLQIFCNCLKSWDKQAEMSMGDDLAVEQVKSLVSICTLLNAQTRRAKGLQLLISIMLIAHSTSKQVNGRFNQSGINPYLKV